MSIPDIRKFFCAAAAKQSSSSSTAQKPNTNTDSSLTKIKLGKNRDNDNFSLTGKLKPEDRDVNGNRKDETGTKKNKEKKDRSKDKSDSKHKEKHRGKKTDGLKNKYESEEVIEIIDEDSNPEEPVKRDRKKGKGRKKRLDQSLSDNDGMDGEKVAAQKRGKKRKKQISSDDDVEMKIDDDDDDDDDIVVKKTKTMKKKGKKMQKLLESDSDEDSVCKDKKKRKSRKKETVVHIGGDDYIEEEVKPQKSFLHNYFTSPSPQKAVKPKVEFKTEVPKGKDVSASSFFGSTSMHRVERKVIHVEKKTEKEEDRKAAETMEIDDEMHSDDDFERTLELLDEEALTAVKKPKESISEKSTVVKENEDNFFKMSLSSKLANKANMSVITPEKKRTVLVTDTPDPKQPTPKKAKMEFVMHRTERKTEKSPTKPTESPTLPDKYSPPKKTPEKWSSKPGGAGKKMSPAKTETETPTQRGSGYRSYINRAGPQALGSKEIPEGAENCLEGLTFVITGVLESFERDEGKSMVERYGGKVTGNVSKKTDYLVAGRDAGVGKMSKAESLKTKILDEDGLLDLIRTRPGKKSKYTIQAEESVKRDNSIPKGGKLDSFKRETPSKSDSINALKTHTSSHSHSQSELTNLNNDQSVISGIIQTDESQPTLLWVDKYKPTQLKQIIGQSGDKSNAKKLLHWLNNWHRNQAAGVKPVTGKFFGRGGSDDGAGFKAALLSGPPGIGKTTTATIVCKEAGFSFVELNASDTRNAKSLKEVISQSVGNTSIVDYIGSGSSSTHGRKHCLVMDEVDGMSGNEDRGGIQEVVNIIKNTKIPIITMCNDRNHQKMRTLANYCYDLRFQRPRVEQIKGAVMSIAFKEGLTIPPPAVNEIILAANQDMRQVIHNLSMWTVANKAVTYDQVKADAQYAKKDMKLGPFDVCRKVFVGGEETNKMTISDKSDLFFHDYNIAPLFVQENYIHVIPYAARGNNMKQLSLLARSADSLCDGDVCDKRIRSGQNWSLLALEAMYASVLPGEYMRGNITQMIAFPSWLGKNSTTGKHERILQELRTHMRLQISGDKKTLNLDYLPYMRNSLTLPLVQKEADGVRDVIQLMDDYDIIKEDFDNIMEITKWPNCADPLSKLSTKTKAAFTRTYNKEVHMTPYSTGVVAKKKRGGGATTGDDYDLLGNEDEGGGVEDEDGGDDLETDTMIKKKTKARGSAKETATKGKGKGPAKGKGTSKTKGKS